MTTEKQVTGVIVVGVDGSAGSLRALRWAMDEARLRGTAVEAVTAWHPGSSSGPDSTYTARDAQELVLATATASGHDGAPLISNEIEQGAPEEVLVNRSRQASLLVVGSHGVGSAIHAALGSTSDYCSRMAACPVVVVPRPVEARIRGGMAVPSR